MSSAPLRAWWRGARAVLLPQDPSGREALASALRDLNIDGRSAIQTPSIDHRPGALRSDGSAVLGPTHSSIVLRRLERAGVPVEWTAPEAGPPDPPPTAAQLLPKRRAFLKGTKA